MSEMSLYASLGRAIADRRKELGLTQADVAARIGLSRASVANIELGRQKVLLHQVYRLGEALGLQRLDGLLPPLNAIEDHRPLKVGVSLGGSSLTAKQRAQITNLVRAAKASTRKGHGS